MNITTVNKEGFSMKKVTVLLITILMMAVSLVGCGGNDDTIQTCIISNSSYSLQEELESANQEDALIVNEPVYASVHFVESPKGMEYTVKWYLDGTEIKSETKATEKDIQDIVVYELEAEQAAAGSLKLEVIYKDTILLTKELIIQ
jgi:hypothetical protein